MASPVCVAPGVLVLVGTTVTCRQPSTPGILLPPTGDAGLLPSGNAQPPRTGTAGLLGGKRDAALVLALTALAFSAVAAARVYAGRGR